MHERRTCPAPLGPVSNLLNSLMGVSSRMIRKKNYPSIRKTFFLRTMTTFLIACNCGGGPIIAIRQYIE